MKTETTKFVTLEVRTTATNEELKHALWTARDSDNDVVVFSCDITQVTVNAARTPKRKAKVRR